MPPVTKFKVADEVPWADVLTPYDEAQFTLYMSLLTAIAELATEEEICTQLFGIDARCEPERARKCFMSHVKRARWLTSDGLHLLFPETCPHSH
jgi:hypothetical protein